MSKSFNSFKRGLSYHAGAGIGEAVRLVTTTGAVIAVGAAVHYATELKMHLDIKKELRKK